MTQYRIRWTTERYEEHEALIDETQLEMLGYSPGFRDLRPAKADRDQVLRDLEGIPAEVRESRDVYRWTKVEG